MPNFNELRISIHIRNKNFEQNCYADIYLHIRHVPLLRSDTVYVPEMLKNRVITVGRWLVIQLWIIFPDKCFTAE